jgi:hypothetical protein
MTFLLMISKGKSLIGGFSKGHMFCLIFGREMKSKKTTAVDQAATSVTK